MDIEVLATAAVKDSLSWTDRLVPFIPEKDKEPMWDGSVHVYATNDKRNENDIGRVPTQVKGKVVSKFRSDVKFDVPVCELKSYLREGGVIFFVVGISAKSEQKRIFYNSLLPYDLVRLIEEAGQQVSKRIKLVPFPTENADKEDIFISFLSARKKQQSTSSLERIVSVEELINKGYPVNLSLQVAGGRNKKDIMDCFLKSGAYLYFNTPLGLSFPVEHITNVEMVSMAVKEVISCGGKQYYSQFTRKRTKNTSEILFGKAFSFILDNCKGTARLNVKLSGKLSERIMDCEFVLAVFQESGFYIGKHFMPINLNTFDGDELETWRKNLEFLKSLKSALDSMGVIVDLDCDKLTEEDEKKIQYWLFPAVNGKPVQIDTFSAIYQPATLTICNLNILVLGLRQSDGSYILKNFFSENGAFALQAEDGSMVPSSCYSILDKDDFLRLSNLDYGHMAENMKMDSPHNLYCDKVNQIILSLLTAYDESKRDEILLAAIDISEWLCSENSKNIIFRLNWLQALKRKQSLGCNEKALLQDILNNPDSMNDCKMGASILLENFDDADTFYSALTEQEKAAYVEYPIMHLWKTAVTA